MSESDGVEVSEQHGAWTVRMWWAAGRTEGGPQRVVIEAAPDAPARDIARGVSTTVLRSINPANAAQRVTAEQSQVPSASASVDPFLSAALRQQLAGQGVSGAYLAVLSTVYAQLSAGGVRPLVPKLAELVGRSAETVSGHLKQARRDGYLTASVAGKPGGEPTSKSTRALKNLGIVPGS